MKLTLDKLGRIVVPKAQRDRFALKAGDELEVVLDFRLSPTYNVASLKEKDGLLICSSEVPVSAWDVGSSLEQERENRNKQIGGL